MRTLRQVGNALLLWASIMTSVALGGACKSQVLEYDTWNQRFQPLLPGIEYLSRRLSKDLRKLKSLPPDVRTFLEKGGDPLTLGLPGYLDGLEAALIKVIDSTRNIHWAKQKLKDSLHLAVLELKANPPPMTPIIGDGNGHGGGGSGGGGGGRGDGDGEAGAFKSFDGEDPAKRFERYVNSGAARKCVVRNTILMFATVITNALGSLDAKWQEYAGPEYATINVWSGLFTGNTGKALVESDALKNAFADPIFRHNNYLNFVQMALLGSFSCYYDIGKSLGLTAISGAVLSAVSQQLTTGEVKMDILILDTVWTTFISRTKTAGVFWIGDQLRRGATPMTRVLMYETALQLISEGGGGQYYSIALAQLEKWEKAGKDSETE
jgi:hypothetical protein